MTLEDIRYYADDFMELWAISHQQHPIYEGGPKTKLWFYALAKRRASLEMACALYCAERDRFKNLMNHIGLNLGGTR